MKIEQIKIEQTDYVKIIIDVSDIDCIRIYQDTDLFIIERDKIQELIDILENEKTKII